MVKRVFTRIVELGGFARAADSPQLPRASVTILIKQLEAHLGVQLLALRAQPGNGLRR